MLLMEGHQPGYSGRSFRGCRKSQFLGFSLATYGFDCQPGKGTTNTKSRALAAPELAASKGGSIGTSGAKSKIKSPLDFIELLHLAAPRHCNLMDKRMVRRRLRRERARRDRPVHGVRR